MARLTRIYINNFHPANKKNTFDRNIGIFIMPGLVMLFVVIKVLYGRVNKSGLRNGMKSNPSLHIIIKLKKVTPLLTSIE